MSMVSGAARAKSAVARAAACGIPRQVVVTVAVPSSTATLTADTSSSGKLAAARAAAARAAAARAAAARNVAAAHAAAVRKAAAARVAMLRALAVLTTPMQRKVAATRAWLAAHKAAAQRAAIRATAARQAAEQARRLAPALAADAPGAPSIEAGVVTTSAECGSSAPVTVPYFVTQHAPAREPSGHRAQTADARMPAKTASTTSAGTSPTVRSAPKPDPKPAATRAWIPKAPGDGLPTASAQSHYIRSLSGHDSDRMPMYRLGTLDAMRNRGTNRYLVLLDIGGQLPLGVRQSINGRFVSYPALVSAVSAYLNGYRLYMDPRSSVTVAVGTNNDLLTSAYAGRAWADYVVDPLRAHAAKFARVDVVGANDIEPGFRNGPAATYQWERSYLHATVAPLIYNGSADGCSWRQISSRCNDGWRSADVARLAGALAPDRITVLPQIYNGWQAQQWARISHEAANLSHRPLTFAGPLTETAACGHDPTCPTMRSGFARQVLARALASDHFTRVAWLPAGTDLDVR
jgi:hypothetical protein